MAGDIFISYRRSDLEHVREIERLLIASGFAESQIFRDERGLRPGGDFRQQLRDTLQRTRVVLAVIGPGGAPRETSLDDPTDWLTVELVEAIRAKKPIRLVTLEGADDELKKPWPLAVESARSPEALRLRQRSGQTQRELATLVRRCGVRPRQILDRWNQALEQLPISKYAEEVERRIGEEHIRVVVVHGPAGHRRSAVVRAVRAGLAGQWGAVVLHEPLFSPLVDVPGAALYDWVGQLIQADSANVRLTMTDHLGFPSTNLTAETLAALRGTPEESELARRQSVEHGADRSRRVGAAVDLLVGDRAPGTATFIIDDASLADTTSQSLAIALIERVLFDDAAAAGERPTMVIVGVEAGSSTFRELQHTVRPYADGCAFVEVNTDAAEFLKAAGVSETLSDQLVPLGYTPVQYATMLRLLDDDGQLAHDDDNLVSLRKPKGPLPTLEVALDRELRPLLPQSVQQTLEVGAVYGMSFPLAAADQVASGGAGDVNRLMQDIDQYDPDGVVVRYVSKEPPRLRFSQTLWRDYFMAQRLRDLLPAQQRAELVTLATALSNNASRYEDWIAAAELFDRAHELEQSAVEYVHAASTARADLSVEAASHAYIAAAERFASYALQLMPGERSLDRARQFIRSGYCWYRAITTSMRGADVDAAFRRADGHLAEALRELNSGAKAASTDLDTMVLSPGGVAAGINVRLRMEAASLVAFLATEQGLRALRQPPTTVTTALAIESFRRALSRCEEGLAGWLYEVLVIVASAGLARAYTDLYLSADHDRSNAECELRTSVHFHAARAKMLLDQLDITTIPETESEAGRALEQARTWADEAQLKMLPRIGLRPAWTMPDDETSLVEFLDALADQMGRPGHGRHVATIAQDLVLSASDLTTDGEPLELLARDAEIASLAHDLFRSFDGSRILQLCRDLGEQLSLDEWRNPVLLHGRLAARYLELGLSARDMLGERRFERVRFAIESHTLGVSEFEEQNPDRDNEARILARVLCLADDSSHADAAHFALDAKEPGLFMLTYQLCLREQEQRLVKIGKMYSPRPT